VGLVVAVGGWFGELCYCVVAFEADFDKLLVGGTFCDLEKAFDCVNHDILLFKFKFYGIRDKDLQLYQSYLGNRCCRTAIYRVAQKTHVFQIIVTLFIFNVKNYVNTKTTCNKCSFDYLH